MGNMTESSRDGGPPAPARASDVFISYASPDRAVADAVCAALEHSGMACWVAPRDVMPGEFYGDAIVRAIDAATAVVLVLSEHSATAAHVLREVERASSKRHPVISLRIDTYPMPAGLEYFLNTSQWLDASGSAPDRAFPALVTAVRRIVARTPDAGAGTARSPAPLNSLDPAPRAAAQGRRRGFLAASLVAARTSSFVFKGKEVDLSEVAHKLNVGAVLEGSVRKDGAHVRITAQLIDAVTGFHLWSQTYDRDLKDVLKLQTEIASAVTTALQATLLANAAATIALGGTQKPAAFDAYLRSKTSDLEKPRKENLLGSIAAFDKAISLDPGFAKAYTSKSLAETGFAGYYGLGTETREHFARARTAAQRALDLAPQLGEAHSAYAKVLEDGFLDFGGALAEHERALVLSPNDSGVLLRAGWFFVDIGRADEGVAMAQRGVSLDQLNSRAYRRYPQGP